MRRLAMVLAVLVVVCAAQGCAYLHCRAQDFLDVIDLGLTFSGKPQIAFYYDFVPIVPIGYGDVEGPYIGIGGGQLHLWSRHRERSLGAILWGQEDVAFGVPDLAGLTTEEQQRLLHHQRVGLIGMAQGPFPGPAYLISCPHYLHILFIGAVASPRYLQMLDFVLGWTTLDLCADDDPNRPLVVVGH